jgi:hypothetical protein
MFGIIGIIAIQNMSKFNKKRQFTYLNSYNRVKKAKFAISGVSGLLEKYDIDIEK